MAKRFLVNIDLVKNQLLNPVLHVLASAPGTPVEGQFYYNSTSKRPEWRTDVAWIDLTARANHSGTQTASTISDFDTQVRTSRLDQMAAPTADVSFNSRKITSLLDPTNAQDAATKAYVDATAVGLDIHGSARLATAAALPANTRTGNVLTASANAALTVDGVAVAVNDRILVKNEATGANNGLYVVTQVGSGALPFILTRSADADTSAEVTAGLFVFAEEGTANADSGWVLTTNNPITLNTTALAFAQFSSAGQVIGGAGLLLTGNTLDVGAGTGISVLTDTVAIDTAVVVRKFAVDVGDGSAVAYTITHNLGTRDVTVAVWLNSGVFDEVQVDVEHTTTNTVILRFAVAPTAAQYRVVVHG